MATDPINQLLEAVKQRLQPLVQADKLRVLIRATDIQPISPGELQIIYVSSAPTDVFEGLLEQVATIELYLSAPAHTLTGPQGAYALIPEIASLLGADLEIEGYGNCRYRGDRKSFADDRQQILIFTMTFVVSIPPF